ncbi:MAG: hypothetical protein HON70_16910, partial [Lentisphaerae bacterium]|nr:hypothetical protein [Lentisphaerota bacterium]
MLRTAGIGLLVIAGGSVSAWDTARILHPSFHSGALGKEKRYSVVLPAGYGADINRRWPVLFLFHGRGRHERSLADDAVCRSALEKEENRPPAVDVGPVSGREHHRVALLLAESPAVERRME